MEGRHGFAGASRTGRMGGPPGAPTSMEESLEEVLDAVAEGRGAVLGVLPGALGLGLGGPARLLQLLSRVLGALDHGLADPLGRVLDPLTDLALADLLGPRLDGARRLLDLRVVGGVHQQDRPGEDRHHECQRERFYRITSPTWIPFILRRTDATCFVLRRGWRRARPRCRGRARRWPSPRPFRGRECWP